MVNAALESQASWPSALKLTSLSNTNAFRGCSSMAFPIQAADRLLLGSATPDP
jgi:hypothetical protein